MLSCTQFKEMLYPTGETMDAIANLVAPRVPSSSLGGSETQSEISSVDSDWSDIRAVALKLGVTNTDDLQTERFKVDRAKLEQMIKSESSIEGMNGAEYFFESIMRTTETYISWPCKLKIGAKSKKDPHVRIVGKPEEVQRAKERILASLDSKGTRVIMKMDVSYTDHSFIIGRGGNNIKRIMEDTATHIHFPDSNRSNPTEKSNQVSLCGSLEGVERARALVRLSTPVLISYELPILAPGRPQPDRETSYVKMIEAKYNVQVIFSSRPKLHSVLILVKGPEKEAAKVKEATQLLINYTCENIANQILVSMQMEISPQHHEIVKGKNNVNLLSIMERTKTKIIFPDLSDMNVKPLKKSQVHITGTIDGVYLSRQQLLGNLPIALIFDFPDNQNDATAIMNMSAKYGVHISLRQKQRQSTLAIVIKGVEKYIDKIYEARHDILHLNKDLIRPVIPDTYFATANEKEFNAAARAALTTLLAGYPDSPKTANVISAATVAAAVAATAAAAAAQLQMSPYAHTNNNNNNNNKLHNNNFLLSNGLLQQQQQQHHLMAYAGTPPPATSSQSLVNGAGGGGVCAPPTHKYLQLHNNNFNRQMQQSQQQQQQHQMNNCYLPSTPVVPPPPPPTPQHHVQQQHQHQHHHQQIISPRNSCSNTSGYQSFSSSTTSLEQAYPPFTNNGNGIVGLGVSSNGTILANGTNNSRTQYSPDSTYSSEAGAHNRHGRRLSDGVLLGLGGGAGNNLVPPIGPVLPGSADSYRNLHYDFKNRTLDFEMKRAMGFKAMERPPVSSELRTPNSNWMGMALSRTSPAPLESVDDNGWFRAAAGCGVDGGTPLISPYALGVTTGIADATPVNRRMHLSQHKDIHSLLTSLNLEHYIKMFVLNEIDLDLFTTLTEDNLMELGITAFGARKKMLAAIHTLLANEAAMAAAAVASNMSTPANTTMTTTTSSGSNSSVGNGSSTTSPRFSGSAAPGAERRPSSQW